MRTTFIYCPTTGCRVFAESPSAKIVQVGWENGSRHVLGGYHFSLGTATPGKWCREDAQRLLGDIVGIAGGVAWDENGTLHAILPRDFILGAVETLRNALPESVWDETALWRAGIYRIVPHRGVAGEFRFEPVAQSDLPAEPDLIVAQVRDNPEDAARPVVGEWGVPVRQALEVMNLQKKGWGLAPMGLIGGVPGRVFDPSQFENSEFSGWINERLPYTGGAQALLPECPAGENGFGDSSGEWVCLYGGGFSSYPSPECEGCSGAECPAGRERGRFQTERPEIRRRPVAAE